MRPTMHGQINQLSPMRSGRYLTSIDSRVWWAWVFQTDNPVVSMRRMKGLKSEVSRISIAANCQKACIGVTQPWNLKLDSDKIYLPASAFFKWSKMSNEKVVEFVSNIISSLKEKELSDFKHNASFWYFICTSVALQVFKNNFFALLKSYRRL